MILQRDELFKVVCFIKIQRDESNIVFGSGTIVSDDVVFLLTAAHVAKSINSTTKMVVEFNNSEPFQLDLMNLIDNNKWIYHSGADIAVVKLNVKPYNEIFRERCFPLDHVNIGEECVSRDCQLTVVGFPSGLGVDGKFSPLTFRSYAASSFLTLQRADCEENSVFFCLENPSMGGYSGGPVFDMGYEIVGSLRTAKEKTVLHGIVHGTMSDNTGGKIALITPMFYLKDLIPLLKIQYNR